MNGIEQTYPQAISSSGQPAGIAYGKLVHSGPTSCNLLPFHRIYLCCIISRWRWRYNIFEDVSRLRIAW